MFSFVRLREAVRNLTIMALFVSRGFAACLLRSRWYYRNGAVADSRDTIGMGGLTELLRSGNDFRTENDSFRLQVEFVRLVVGQLTG